MLDFIDNNWKPLTFTTIIFLILVIGLLVNNLYQTGEFVPRDIELRGGKLITVEVQNVDVQKLEEQLPESSIRLVSGIEKTLLIETEVDADEQEIKQILEQQGIDSPLNIRTVGPTLGEAFWQQTQLAIGVAFVLMIIVVFILFRTLVPSGAVILAAVTDILGTLAVMQLFGIDLSLSSLAAMLMLIGYSVDTDVLLTTEILRKEGEIFQKIKNAARTGLTMSITTLSVLTAMFLISNSPVISEIAAVLIIGLVIDLPATWFTNAGILRWYSGDKK